MENNPLLPILQDAGVATAKQQEILTVVGKYLEKVIEWDALANVEVKDHTDVKGMKVASGNRKTIKRERLEGDKFLKAQRELVKEKMAEFKAEDTAYLKIAQYFEQVAKEKEEILEAKEKLKEVWEAEQKKLLAEQREAILKEVVDNPSIYSAENLPEDAFNDLVAALKQQKEDRIKRQLEEEAEAERIRKEAEDAENLLREKKKVFNTRKEEMAPYFHLTYEGKGTITVDTDEETYQRILLAAKKALQVEEEKKKVDALKIANSTKLFALGFAFDGVNFTWEGMVVGGVTVLKSKESFDEFLGVLELQIEEKKVEIQKAKEEQAAQKKAQEEAEKLKRKQLVFDARKEEWESLKIHSDKVLSLDTTAEEWIEMVQEANKKLEESSPINLGTWVESFSLPMEPLTKNQESLLKIADIKAKFELFKKWAKKL
jgi:hypothetical protein